MRLSHFLTLFNSEPLLASHWKEISSHNRPPFHSGEFQARSKPGTRVPPHIPRLSLYSSPSSPQYYHDTHSCNSRSHPCIPSWPFITITGSCLERPTSSFRALLR